ncbi:MAG: hypothetical protein ACYC99_05105 [Candidatus Geothermincolia bacterium]
MVKRYRTRRATEADSKRFAAKAIQYRSAMRAAYTQRFWDAAVSNGVHAVILMANALTTRKSGEYYIGQDHGQAPDYFEVIEGPDAANPANQMRQVLYFKALAEYESKACTEKEATKLVNRVDKFFSWAEKRKP